MDLQTVKNQHGGYWAWARTGAVILFLVTALLLAASLTAARKSEADNTSLQTKMGLSSLLQRVSAS